MANVEQYESFRIVVSPLPETSDHEVRFIADGVDLIERHWHDMIGLNPRDILTEARLLPGDERFATIARCDCGFVGCDRVDVEITRSQDRIVWECAEYTDVGQPARLEFIAGSYEAEVRRAMTDYCGVTPD